MSAALLTRTTTRDRAFERLYRRHVHEVYRYLLAVLRNQADAEDATQATFLSAFRAFDRGEEPLKPRNWLLKIAHNECRQRFRASARRPKEVEWDERTPSPRPDESVPTADEIRTALAHLSFNQRSALVMRELEGRSYTEIGEILDLSVSAVETVLFRARRALREQLEGGLSCGEAEATLSRRMDGRLPVPEQRALRAHLRECPECSTLERKQRARRAAVKRLGVVQLPPSLAGFLGGGGSVTGGMIAGSGVVAKAAAVVAAGVVAGGVSHQAVQAVAAAEPARAPRSELATQTAEPGSAVARDGAGGAASAQQARGAPGARTSLVRERVNAALARRRSGGGSGAAETPTSAQSGGSAAPTAGAPGTRGPVAPQPVRPVVETASGTIPSLPIPAPPVPTPEVSIPPAPPLPVEIPPVPPLPPLPPPPGLP